MSEIRALLLTDVVDSTRLTETLGNTAMALLWAAHDRLARDLLPAWRGREIDKSDGMLLLFESAPDAIAYAMAYHRALAALNPPLSARAGMHVGPVVLRENSAPDVARGAKPLEVDGMAKPTAARVMSLAQGGQTLLTSEARDALGESHLRLQSHGHWRIKGVSEPLELFEAGDAESPFFPPPDATKSYRVVLQDGVWLPVRSIKHSLPAERDGFVGRRETLGALAKRLDAGARLVSVLGIGGTGKTRLATRFGWSWLGDYPGGVWFCDLSPARSVDGIVFAVAQGLDVPLGKDDPVTQLGHAIAGRGRCLLILDNFEQVARYAEETLGRWLNRASNAQFLVTTREVLGLQGEEVLAVAPLQAADAVTLFLRRAETAKLDFQPSTEDPSVITRLVELLDCLPLAIELAAARVRVLPPKVLLARMSERFKLLSSAGGRRDRQATLRATFDWSWDLLSLPEKAALAQLSVFEGGCTLESIETVLDLSMYDDAPLIMDALQLLLQKSFVRQVTEARFDLLVSVREYASEHLRTDGRYQGSGPAALAAAEVRHGAYFAGLDEKVATANQGAELNNFVVACRRAVARGDTDVAANTLERAWAGLTFRGPFRVGAELASLVRDAARLKGETIALVERIAGSALGACGKEHEAYPHFEASLVSACAAADRRGECRALVSLGSGDKLAGRAESARVRFNTALVVAREMGDLALQGYAYNGLGNLDYALGRMREAHVHFEASLSLAREAGDRRLEGDVLGNLATLYEEEGNIDEFRSYGEAALAVARELGYRRLEGVTLCNLGCGNQVQGRLEEALAQLEAALAVARDLGHAGLECIVLCNLGMVFESMARFGEALRHFEAALVMARELRDRRAEGQILSYLGLRHAREARFGEARSCLELGEGLLRAVSDRLYLGVLLCSRAETEQLAGDIDLAGTALAEAELIAVEVGAGPDAELGLALSRVRDLLAQARTR